MNQWKNIGSPPPLNNTMIFKDFRNWKKEKVVICPYCNKPAVWCENKEKYGRNYWKSYMCYLCKDCDAYVGCHNNTREPLGTMANDELRRWRIRTHEFIDPIWKENKMERREVYQLLEKHFWKPIHTWESDIEMCQKIIEFLKKEFYNN